MKILQVIDVLEVGGGERVFVDACNILFENNVDVTALLLQEEQAVLELDLNVPKIHLDRKNKWSLISMYRCYKIIIQYDIVHCHFRHVYRYISIIKLLFKFKARVVFHDHFGSIDVHQQVPFLFDSVFKPDYYIGVSATLCSWAEKKLKISNEKIFLLQNIVRKKHIESQKEVQSYFLLVSNIKPLKNNLFAIKLCKLMSERLIIAGKNQNENYYSKVVKELDDLITINSTISSAQGLIKSAKLGLHTSKSESGPLVLIEYLAQGIPFLAYETGEVAQILKPHFPDFFIDNFEVDNWKNRIERILKAEPDQLKMLSIFEKYFGEDQYYERMEQIYQCITQN